MTDKEKLDALRAEIHRLVDVRGYDRGMAIDLFAFMDTLPNEPVSNDLEEAARKAGQKYFPDECNIWARPNYEAKKAEYAFKEGANWGRNQAKVEIQAQSMALPHGCLNKEPVSEDLEKAASQYPSVIRTISPQWESELENAFKAGAEWQKEQILGDDNKQYHRLRHETLKRLYENEAKLKLMLDNSLEGYIEKYEQIGGHNYLSLKIPMLSKPDDCKDGDKIKLIILKEE